MDPGNRERLRDRDGFPQRAQKGYAALEQRYHGEACQPALKGPRVQKSTVSTGAFEKPIRAQE